MRKFTYVLNIKTIDNATKEIVDENVSDVCYGIDNAWKHAEFILINCEGCDNVIKKNGFRIGYFEDDDCIYKTIITLERCIDHRSKDEKECKDSFEAYCCYFKESEMINVFGSREKAKRWAKKHNQIINRKYGIWEWDAF